MLRMTDLYREEKEFVRNKHILLPLQVTWTNVADKTLTTDGSFSDATNTTSTIRAAIEALTSKQQEKYRAEQGVSESTDHHMYTLKANDIAENDLITYSGKTYRIKYVFPKQYDIDFTECLLSVES